MKKLFLIALLLTGLEAKKIVLPGGGGEGRKYYVVSVEDFLKIEASPNYIHLQKEGSSKPETECFETKKFVKKITGKAYTTNVDAFKGLVSFYKKDLPYSAVEYFGTKTEFAGRGERITLSVSDEKITFGHYRDTNFYDTLKSKYFNFSVEDRGCK